VDEETAVAHALLFTDIVAASLASLIIRRLQDDPHST